MRVGEISGVTVDALEFCFGMTVKDTDLDGAALDLERVRVRYRCDACAARVPPRRIPGRVPRLRASGAAMVAGDELGLSFLELE